MLETITKEMLETIKAEADKKAKEAIEQANMLAEYFVAQATIERTSDVAITRSIAKAQAANATTAKLERLEAECTAIVAAMMNISLDTSVINEDSMKALWLNAEVRALKQYNEAMDGDAIQTVEA